MSKPIYVSINPKATKKIADGLKNHEFRNYIPKKQFDTLYVYVTSPVSKLVYIIKIGNIVSHPNIIDEDGDGNKEFNIGNKSKYAYEIESVYELQSSYTLDELKETFNFTPPQSYAYGERYSLLTKKIETDEKIMLWRKRK